MYLHIYTVHGKQQCCKLDDKETALKPRERPLKTHLSLILLTEGEAKLNLNQLTYLHKNGMLKHGGQNA